MEVLELEVYSYVKENPSISPNELIEAFILKQRNPKTTRNAMEALLDRGKLVIDKDLKLKIR
jgi:hypothetical protein